MHATLNDFVKAGAICSLVKYHDHLGGRDADWIPTKAYAYREFRDAPSEVVESLVRMARASKLAADCQNALRPGERLCVDIIPGMGVE